MSLLSACATSKALVPLCDEPELEGGKFPTYGDLYDFGQKAQGALRECNARIRAYNDVL